MKILIHLITFQICNEYPEKTEGVAHALGSAQWDVTAHSGGIKGCCSQISIVYCSECKVVFVLQLTVFWVRERV